MGWCANEKKTQKEFSTKPGTWKQLITAKAMDTKECLMSSRTKTSKLDGQGEISVLGTLSFRLAVRTGSLAVEDPLSVFERSNTQSKN